VLPLNPHEKGPKNLIQQTEYKLKNGIVRNGGADKEGQKYNKTVDGIERHFRFQVPVLVTKFR